MRFQPQQHRANFIAFCLLIFLTSGLDKAFGQSGTGGLVNDTPAVLSRVKVTLDKNGPAIEISASRHIVPTISKLDRPLRIVIDLQNAEMSVVQKRIKVQSDDIGSIRLHQYTSSPPVARLVVDLRKPLSYTVENTADTVVVRLHLESEEATAKPPSVPVLTKAPVPVAVPVSPASYGNVVSADRLVSGASVTAGRDTMLLRLPRGGEIYVCPNTSVSVTRSPNGSDLMVGMGTGGLETHYALENSTDSIMTPDFRILLRGPGEFHYAIRSDSQGNTCMRALPGNTAPAVVSELLGDGIYEVQPDDKIVFHMGRVSAADTAFHSGSTHVVESALPMECGCPAPPTPTLIASNGADPNLQGAMHLAQPDEPQKTQSSREQSAPGADIGPSASNSSAGPETASLPALKENEPHVVISAPIVFTAQPASSPAPVADDKNLPVVSSDRVASIEPESPPPTTTSNVQTKPHRGFGARLKHVFGAIFR